MLGLSWINQSIAFIKFIKHYPERKEYVMLLVRQV